jgi:hypothetical protein
MSAIFAKHLRAVSFAGTYMTWSRRRLTARGTASADEGTQLATPKRKLVRPHRLNLCMRSDGKRDAKRPKLGDTELRPLMARRPQQNKRLLKGIRT